jgi:hypothetical protein
MRLTNILQLSMPDASDRRFIDTKISPVAKSQDYEMQCNASDIVRTDKTHVKKKRSFTISYTTLVFTGILLSERLKESYFYLWPLRDPKGSRGLHEILCYIFRDSN